MNRLPTHLLGLLLAFLLCLGSPALAQDDPLEALSDADFDRVVELLEQARQAEEAEQWRIALGFFEEVSAVVVLPEVRIREARANEALGEIPEAAAMYAGLAAGTSEVSTEAAEALARLAEAHPPTLRLAIAGAEADVSVDGGPATPFGVGEHDITLPPGAHIVVVQAVDNAPVELDVELAIGETQERYLTFVAPPPVVSAPSAASPEEPVATTMDEPREPRDRNARIALPVTVTTLAVGAFVTGGVLGADSNRIADDYRSLRASALGSANQIAPNEGALSELRGLQDDSVRRATQANIMFGVGGALAVGSAVTWWWARKGGGGRDVALLPMLGGGQMRVQF